jgi:hypothetical protein
MTITQDVQSGLYVDNGNYTIRSIAAYTVDNTKAGLLFKELSTVAIAALPAPAVGSAYIIWNNTLQRFVVRTNSTTYTFMDAGLFGTMATQDANAVNITGGTESGVAITSSTINSTTIGLTAAAAANFTALLSNTIGFNSTTVAGLTLQNLTNALKASLTGVTRGVIIYNTDNNRIELRNNSVFTNQLAYLTDISSSITALNLGTMSTQNANAVNITGGTESGIAITSSTINSTTIGLTTPAAAQLTTLLSNTIGFNLNTIAGLTLQNLTNILKAALTGITPGVIIFNTDTNRAELRNNTVFTNQLAYLSDITALNLGTMSTQNSNAVVISGGSINGTNIGLGTPGPGGFTSISCQTLSFTNTAVYGLKLNLLTTAQRTSIGNATGTRGNTFYDTDLNVPFYSNGNANVSLNYNSGGVASGATVNTIVTSVTTLYSLSINAVVGQTFPLDNSFLKARAYYKTTATLGNNVAYSMVVGGVSNAITTINGIATNSLMTIDYTMIRVSGTVFNIYYTVMINGANPTTGVFTSTVASTSAAASIVFTAQASNAACSGSLIGIQFDLM